VEISSFTIGGLPQAHEVAVQAVLEVVAERFMTSPCPKIIVSTKK
jgi:hypothetical protein